ncbi:hypothetical protein ACPA9J_21255 [Pseudomonas aeruginosa]
MFESTPFEAGALPLPAPIPCYWDRCLPPASPTWRRTFHAEAGVVISASHNPDDNGVKFFSGRGPSCGRRRADDRGTARCADDRGGVRPSRQGFTRINDAAGRYIRFCKSSVPTSTDSSGLKVVLGCANGVPTRSLQRLPGTGRGVTGAGSQPKMA